MAKYHRQPWTAADEIFLTANYGRVPAAELAAQLNRDVRSVYQKAIKLKITRSPNWATDAQILELINELHTHGYSDAEVASQAMARLKCDGVDRHRVGQLRSSLGLPSNKLSARQRNRVRDKTRQQLEAAGLATLAELRIDRWNKWKRSLGWPEHLTVRAVQSLEMFYRHGPLTRAQLCKLLGVSSKKRTAPISNTPGGTVLAELARAGLISSCAKAVPLRGQAKGGKTKTVNLYFLNPGVEPNHEQRQRSVIAGRREPSTERDGSDPERHR